MRGGCEKVHAHYKPDKAKMTKLIREGVSGSAAGADELAQGMMAQVPRRLTSQVKRKAQLRIDPSSFSFDCSCCCASSRQRDDDEASAFPSPSSEAGQRTAVLAVKKYGPKDEDNDFAANFDGSVKKFVSQIVMFVFLSSLLAVLPGAINKIVLDVDY